MFPRTDRSDNMRLDVHSVVSTHVETIALISRKDKYGAER